jgi:hypothetical protein
MELAEWRELAEAVNADIEAMARASQVHRQMRATIRTRQIQLTEEQFIDAEAFGGDPGQPRVFEVAGARLKVWKVHRLGMDLSDVKGADLYYELGDSKYVLVQYKKPSNSGRVHLDDEQLTELENSCPVWCLPTKRFNCGAWYALAKPSGAAYFPACEVRELFQGFQTRKWEFFVNGMTKDYFQEEFGRCHIGARTQPINVTEYERMSLERDRVVVHVRQEEGRR